MKNLNIFLLIFTILMVNYCKSTNSFIRRQILANYKNNNEILNDPVEIKCEYLNNIKTNNSIIETKYKLKIIGKIVYLKNVPFKNHCNGSIVIVEIFATEKIIIDRNFNAKGKNMVFILAAPIWYVKGRKVINLNGYNGKKRRKSMANNGNYLKNINGKHGKEGFPGGPGGQFHGIAGYIINQNNLIINFNGGNGSNGQIGGNGGKGKNGTEFHFNVKKIHNNGYVPGFKVVVDSIEKVFVNGDLFYYILEDVIGKEASNGGNGGNGGPGGEGGLPGHYFLYNLNNSTCNSRDVLRFIDTENGKNGVDGVYGFGGYGGESGRPGKNVSLLLRINYKKKIEILRNITFEHDQFLTKGHNGISGQNINRKLKPKKLHPLQIFDTTEYLYKNFLRSHIEKFNANSRIDPWTRQLQQILLNCPYYRRKQNSTQMFNIN
ncbi:uncharacterized protein LOC127277433 [Leptopilina boulardi]|uniref:uncharacterized protein LOC127277433 n=1 Tax=Leptopilina boulardi TaxID=63433 RepID=UPI0021F62B25|nr:uncharacterized protein LOC127277433 [Leptopilina boulardi]